MAQSCIKNKDIIIWAVGIIRWEVEKSKNEQ